MIGDEDKYATKNENMFYFILAICFITYTNINQNEGNVKVWKSHLKGHTELWEAQIEYDTKNNNKWKKQYVVDSTIVQTIKEIDLK